MGTEGLTYVVSVALVGFVVIGIATLATKMRGRKPTAGEVNRMFVTILEGTAETVPQTDLSTVWRNGTAILPSNVLPPGFLESSLLRADDGAWRIVTFWESKEAVAASRVPETASALFMFERDGSPSEVSVWTVEGRVSAR
jgi:hypothetical protein